MCLHLLLYNIYIYIYISRSLSLLSLSLSLCSVYIYIYIYIVGRAHSEHCLIVDPTLQVRGLWAVGRTPRGGQPRSLRRPSGEPVSWALGVEGLEFRRLGFREDFVRLWGVIGFRVKGSHVLCVSSGAAGGCGNFCFVCSCHFKAPQFPLKSV